MSVMPGATRDALADVAAPAPRAIPETVKFLCDLGTKRHDLAERSYDALNTRLAALFAFNSFLVPASIGSIRAAFTAVPGQFPALRGGWCVVVLGLWCASLVTVGAACVWGYVARRVKSLPDPLALYRCHGADELADAGIQVLVTLDTAWRSYRDAMTFKSRCLNVALGGIALEVVVLLFTVVVSL